MSKSQSILKKKLLYQSQNRGCRETDLIIGSFAQQYINEMTEDELHEFQNILEISDTDFYDWYTKKKPLPNEYKTILMSQLLNFIPTK